MFLFLLETDVAVDFNEAAQLFRDRVGLAINDNSSISCSAGRPAFDEVELNTSQTRSLPLPVLYSSTHEKSSGTMTLSSRISHCRKSFCAKLFVTKPFIW